MSDTPKAKPISKIKVKSMDLGISWGTHDVHVYKPAIEKAGLKTSKKKQEAKELDLFEQALETFIEKKGMSGIILDDLVEVIADITKSKDKDSITEHLLSYDSSMWLI